MACKGASRSTLLCYLLDHSRFSVLANSLRTLAVGDSQVSFIAKPVCQLWAISCVAFETAIAAFCDLANDYLLG